MPTADQFRQAVPTPKMSHGGVDYNGIAKTIKNPIPGHLAPEASMSAGQSYHFGFDLSWDSNPVSATD